MGRKISSVKRERLEKKKEKITERLTNLYEKEEEMLSSGAVQSYSIGSRSISKYGLSLKDLQSEIQRLEQELEILETTLLGGSPRKVVAAVPRDW